MTAQIALGIVIADQPSISPAINNELQNILYQLTSTFPFERIISRETAMRKYLNKTEKTYEILQTISLLLVCRVIECIEDYDQRS